MTSLTETAPIEDPTLEQTAADYDEHIAELDEREAAHRATSPPYSPYTERTVEGEPVDEQHESAWLSERRSELGEWGEHQRSEAGTWRKEQEAAGSGWVDRVIGAGEEQATDQGGPDRVEGEGTAEQDEAATDVAVEPEPEQAALEPEQPSIPEVGWWQRRQLRLPGPLTKRLIRGLFWRKMCETIDPSDRERVVASTVARNLIHNDGASTIVVHSTTQEVAQSTFTDGLKIGSKYDDHSVPDLYFTGLLLAGPEDRRQTGINTHLMSYRYAADERNSAKVVMVFPQANPGTARNENPFEGTFLEHADGTNISAIEQEGNFRFAVNAGRVMGYFDQDTGGFIPNPQFSMPEQAAA